MAIEKGRLLDLLEMLTINSGTIRGAERSRQDTKVSESIMIVVGMILDIKSKLESGAVSVVYFKFFFFFLCFVYGVRAR